MTSTPATRPIVVGIDGSPPSDGALDWAAAQAVAEGIPLVLLTAAPAPSATTEAWLVAHGVDAREVSAGLQQDAQDLLSRCEARIRTTYPDLDIHHDIRLVDPRDALLDAATHADLLVVGTRGLGPVRRLLLGSVATAVVKETTCPTVVVRPARPPEDSAGVLVGVAGEDGDAAPVDLAFRVAAARGLPVTALHCVWDVVGVDEPREVSPDRPDYDDERAVLALAVAPAAARHPGVEVRQVITRGFADERLIRASRDADVIVLGHRRKPFLNELVYGSVAPRVVEHARCSAIVVPFAETPS